MCSYGDSLRHGARGRPAGRSVRSGGGAPEDVWEDELRLLEGIGAALESERAGEAYFTVDGLRGSTAAGAPGSWRRRGGRRRCRRIGIGWRRPASPHSPPPGMGRRSSPPAPSATFPDPAPIAILTSPARPRRARGGGPGRDLEAARHRHPGSARRPPRRPGRRSLRAARPASPRARPRRGHPRCAPRVPTRSWPRRSSCPKGPPAPSSTAPWSCWSTASSPLPSAGADGAGAAPRRPALRRGSWSVEQGLGRPTASAPDPALAAGAAAGGAARRRRSLRLRALALGPPAGDQLGALGRRPGAAPAADSARRCARSAPRRGPEALLKILPVDSASRIPERRAILTPFPEAAAMRGGPAPPLRARPGRR